MQKEKLMESMRQVDFSDLSFPLIVVYRKPKDYPDAYVARVWEGARNLLQPPIHLCIIVGSLRPVLMVPLSAHVAPQPIVFCFLPEGTKPAIYKMVLMQAGVLQLSIISTLFSFLPARIALPDPGVLNDTLSH